MTILHWATCLDVRISFFFFLRTCKTFNPCCLKFTLLSNCKLFSLKRSAMQYVVILFPDSSGPTVLVCECVCVCECVGLGKGTVTHRSVNVNTTIRCISVINLWPGRSMQLYC